MYIKIYIKISQNNKIIFKPKTLNLSPLLISLAIPHFFPNEFFVVYSEWRGHPTWRKNLKVNAKNEV